jgi:aryl-alcohol dehydrogenase-like predicted oxidoreductase
VALAYVLGQPEHVLPVVGTRTEAHLDEALAAEAIELGPDELAWLEG